MNHSIAENKIKTKLEACIAPNIIEALKENEAFVAGGCLTSILCSLKINDVDIFFRDSEQRVNVNNIILASTDCKLKFDSPNASTFSTSKKLIQTIKKIYGQPEKVIDSFDFFACMGAYDFKTEKLICHEKMLEDCADKKLHFSLNAFSPLGVIARIPKYVKKGFYISTLECVKIGIICTTLDFLSWEELQEQVNGMDVAIMEDAFGELATEYEQEDEFSATTFIETIDKVLKDKKEAKKNEKL